MSSNVRRVYASYNKYLVIFTYSIIIKSMCNRNTAYVNRQHEKLPVTWLALNSSDMLLHIPATQNTLIPFNCNSTALAIQQLRMQTAKSTTVTTTEPTAEMPHFVPYITALHGTKFLGPARPGPSGPARQFRYQHR